MNQSSQNGWVAAKFVRHVHEFELELGSVRRSEGTESRAEVESRIVRDRVLVDIRHAEEIRMRATDKTYCHSIAEEIEENDFGLVER